MTRFRVLILAGLLATPAVASAQPTDLDVCSSSSIPYCQDPLGPAVSSACGRLFDVWFGRVMWYPLQCVGPITISIETLAGPFTHYPLYVEVVPWRNVPYPCVNEPGYLIWTVRGVENDCGGWETSLPMDITYLVPLGSMYYIRLHYLAGPTGYSPGTDCIRVTATPVTSGVTGLSWGSVKTLYH